MTTQTGSERPQGVTILGILFIVLALFSLVWGLFVMGVGGVAGLFGFVTGVEGGLFGPFWSGVIGIGTAILDLIIAFGLLGLRKWAWLLAIIGVGLSVLSYLAGMFGGGLWAFCCNGIGIVIPAAILFYLLRPDVRRAFGRA
jgi:hypothetical protein